MFLWNRRIGAGGGGLVMLAACPIYRAAAIFSPAKRAAVTAHDFACKGMWDIRPRMNHGASPSQKLLCFLKILSTDDCGMRIYCKILFLFAVVDFLLPRKAACGIFLLRQRITDVFFILQYILNRGQLPVRGIIPCWTAHSSNFFCDILHTDACEVTVEDISDD